MGYYNVKRIPRKLKKKVKEFTGIHWNTSNLNSMLWYYLERNINTRKFKQSLINSIIKENL